MNAIFGSLALLSLVLTLWQWLAGRRFPLHRRVAVCGFGPGVTLLKPLKGCEASTESCLRSWFDQDYPGAVQLLFGVASAEDPVCEVVRRLLEEYPARQAQLLVCGPLTGTNLKVSKLLLLEQLAEHDILVVSDADVRVPADFLANVVQPLQEPTVGLVNCFYQLANATTPAMRWEAVAINADFWGQVLQAQSLKPIDFALGAVMATRRQQLKEIGGFAALANCLADDYQLGNRIARGGHRIAICPVVVACWSDPMGWKAVWKHQLRWARTIRVCQPLPYFFSLLNNGTVWPLLWVAAKPSSVSVVFGLVCWLVRLATARDLQQRLTRTDVPWRHAWLVPAKDLLQTALWLLAFMGNHIEWRGEKMRLRRDGTLVRSAHR